MDGHFYKPSKKTKNKIKVMFDFIFSVYVCESKYCKYTTYFIKNCLIVKFNKMFILCPKCV